MRCRAVVPFLGILLFVAADTPAQDAAAGPPPVLSFTLEEIKPGNMAAHDKSVAGYFALFDKAQAGSRRIGLAPASGDTNHVLYLEAHASFAEMEAKDRKLEDALASNPAWTAEMERLTNQGGPLHSTQRTALAVYREDLSYRPHKMEEVAKARYFQVTTLRVKVGRTPDYVAYVQQLNAAREKAKIADVHTAVYQVVTGAPVATFYTLSTNRSLAEWDEFGKAMAARNKATDEALGGDAVVRARSQMAEQIYTTISSTLYSVNRALSRPTTEFAAMDPGFWSPKPTSKALATKKEEKK
jgi:hypothetical protein